MPLAHDDALQRAHSGFIVEKFLLLHSAEKRKKEKRVNEKKRAPRGKNPRQRHEGVMKLQK